MQSIFISNPFWDKTAYSSEEFLEEQKIKKSETTLEFDSQRMRELWKLIKTEDRISKRCGGSGANVMIPFAHLSQNKCKILGKIGNQDKARSGYPTKNLGNF